MTREEAIARIKDHKIVHEMNEPRAILISEALDMAIETLKQQPCEDAISRQAVIEGLRTCYDTETKEYSDGSQWINYEDAVAKMEDLPPVTPQPKIGHWIQTNEFFINQDGQFIYKFICSECKSLSYFRKSNKKAIGANVCPNCECRMVEPQERSEK